MSWAEWEQLKADAAARASTQMRLNSIPADPGGSSSGGGLSPQLKSKKQAWIKAGGDTKGLKDDIGKALTKLEEGQSGLGDTTGLQSATAQKELFDSWRRYVHDVSGRCGDLGGLMERSGHEFWMLDSDVKAQLDKISIKYQDTDPLGGHSKGK
ncbi:hypothetical protein GCM10010503_03080 [Streptomyces lucensis JCM 4490]|uniref:AG1 protein n=1 Tax=Streptomyces lucensis JCM 4490 TaxID=1306176 RepID=A0A918ITF3_9ACTN|nr:hypothetical protein [Streptomyces lucensis]GGW30853.1 hypothetical protein GCM10010503_03080 [Streptomyces lucensis JCM 4490]